MPVRRIEPGPGQESVWDYPRPPAVEPSDRRIRVVFNAVAIADSRKAWRVLETSHPPVYYLPPEDVQLDYFAETRQSSFCEWKGRARYFTIAVGDRRAENAAWCYPNPSSDRFAPIAGYLAFYPSQMDACYVDDERARSQAGDFYGGWITDAIVGPFKGGPGTWGW